MQEYTPTPDFYNDYIAHHGILGMKWGKKNGPPYPLSPGAHSQGEKKAGYKKSIGGGRNEEMYDRKKKKPDRHERAANASARDAEDLRKHGYTKEADAVQKVSDQQRAKSKTANKNSRLTNQESDVVQQQVDSNTISTKDWNKTSTYSKGFLDYISWQVGSPEQVDDPELLALLAMEYEAGTGKAARKDGNFYLSDDAAKEYGVSKKN